MLGSGHRGPGPEKAGLPRHSLTHRGSHQRLRPRHGRPLIPTPVSGPASGAGTGLRGSQRMTRTSLSGIRPRHMKVNGRLINDTGRRYPHLKRGQTRIVVADACRLMLHHTLTIVLTTRKNAYGRHIWTHSSVPRPLVRRGFEPRKQKESLLKQLNERRKISRTSWESWTCLISVRPSRLKRRGYFPRLSQLVPSRSHQGRTRLVGYRRVHLGGRPRKVARTCASLGGQCQVSGGPCC